MLDEEKFKCIITWLRGPKGKKSNLRWECENPEQMAPDEKNGARFAKVFFHYAIIATVFFCFRGNDDYEQYTVVISAHKF